ncbi:DUF2312 domain-containing protein [Castellaniella sp.]|uniref:DUF2312 domain-containing protein n=1 Tax=Castellaniella sp. TaxID=1955812 RepID=UPI002AFE7D7E|nr:DUF2312 domain-containing protein [Castellaniella sp.]
MSSNGYAAGALRAFRDRIARLEEEKKALQADIKDVYAEVKACGFDTKAMRVVVKRYLEDESQRTERRETEELAKIYLANLGMLDGTPLGDSARERISQPPQDDRDFASEPPSDAAVRIRSAARCLH